MTQHKEEKSKPRCLICRKEMHEVHDKVTKKYTGHLWRCECMLKGTTIKTTG